MTIPLLKQGFKVIAVDISKKSLGKLFWLAKKNSSHKNLKIKTNLSKENNIEIISGCDILHHINIDNYFSLFYKKLKKNGLIIFSEPNFFNPSWIFFISLFLNWREEKK